MSNEELAQPALSPETVQALTRLAGRVDEIEALLDMIGGMLRRGPEIADNIGASVGEMRNTMGGGDGASGAVTYGEIQTMPRLQSIAKAENLDKLLSGIESLTEILSSPKVQSFLASDALPATESLTRLAGRADELEYLVEMISGFIRRGPEIADNLNHAVAEFRGAGTGSDEQGLIDMVSSVNVEELKSTVQKARTVFSSVDIDEVIYLFNELKGTILNPQTISIISSLGESLVESSETAKENGASVSGVFSLMKVLKDPDVARTLGFAVEFAKAFGKKLK